MREGGLQSGKTWGSAGNIRSGCRSVGRCPEGTGQAAKLEDNRKREAFARRKNMVNAVPFLFQNRKILRSYQNVSEERIVLCEKSFRRNNG